MLSITSQSKHHAEPLSAEHESFQMPVKYDVDANLRRDQL